MVPVPKPPAGSAPLCRRLWPEERSREEHSRSNASNSDTDGHILHSFVGSGASSGSGQSSASCGQSIQPNAQQGVTDKSDGQGPNELRSILRMHHSSKAGKAAIGKTISFASSSAVTSIRNFSCCEDLWYPNFAVDCNRCDAPVQWGAEGILMGAPGRSRFSQWQVLCSSCLSDKLYGDLGAWVVVACANLANNGADSDGTIAYAPMEKLMNHLLQLCPKSGSDQLAALLGKEAEAPDVRAVILQKARTHLGELLRVGAGARSASSRECAKPAGEGQAQRVEGRNVAQGNGKDDALRSAGPGLARPTARSKKRARSTTS